MPIPILAPNLLGQAAQQRHDVFNTDRQNAENRAAAKEAFKQKMIGTFVDAGLQAAQDFGMAAYKEATEGARDAERVGLERTRTNESVAAERAKSNVDQIGYKPPKPIPVDESPFKPDAVLTDVKPEDVDPFLPKMNVVAEQKPAPGPRYELPPSAPVAGRKLERYGATIEAKAPTAVSPSEVLAAVPTRTGFAEMAEKRAATANKTQALDSVAEQAKSMPVYAQEWQRATIEKREADAIAAALAAANKRFEAAKAKAEQNQAVIKDIVKARDENAADLYRGGQIKHAADLTASEKPVLDEYGFMTMQTQTQPQSVRFGAIPGGTAAPSAPPTRYQSFVTRTGKAGFNAPIGTASAPVGDWLALAVGPKYKTVLATEQDRTTANELLNTLRSNPPGSPAFKRAEDEGALMMEKIQLLNAPVIAGTKDALAKSEQDKARETRLEQVQKGLDALRASAQAEKVAAAEDTIAQVAADADLAAQDALAAATADDGKITLQAKYAPTGNELNEVKALSQMDTAAREASLRGMPAAKQRVLRKMLSAHNSVTVKSQAKVKAAERAKKQSTAGATTGAFDPFPTAPAPASTGPKTLQELIANTTMTQEQKQAYAVERGWATRKTQER